MCLLVLLAACKQQAPFGFVPGSTTEFTAPANDPDRLIMSDRYGFTNAQGMFSLEVPQGWVASESSVRNEVIVQFRDQAENAVIRTNVFTMTERLPKAQLAELLHTHLRESYGRQSGFALREAKPQRNGQLVSWGYNVLQGNVSVGMAGQSFIEQQGLLIGLVSVVVPSSQRAALQPAIDQVISSYALHGDFDSPLHSTSALAAVEIAGLESYKAADGMFELDVPVGWVRQSTSSEHGTRIRWNDQGDNSWLMVDVQRDDSQRSPNELALLVEDVIGDALGDHAEFLAETVELFDDRARLNWRYTSTDSTGRAVPFFGTSMAMQQGEYVAIVFAVAPASQAEQVRTRFEAIMESFTL